MSLLASHDAPHKPALWTKDFKLAFSANLLMFFAFYLIIPVLPLYIIERFNASETITGFVLSLYTISALFIRPLAGYVVDLFPRKPIYLLFYAIFIAVFVGYMVANVLIFFIILRVIHGASFGINTVAGSSLALSIIPPQRQGEGIGYFGMSANLAMAIGPATSLFLYSKYSFNTIFLASFISGAIGFLCASLIKESHKMAARAKGSITIERFFLIKGLRPGISLFLMALGYGILINYMGVYGKTVESSAGLFFTLQAIGIATARVLSGKMLNNGQISKTIYLGASMLTIGYIMLIFVPFHVMFYLCSIMFGLGFGFIAPAFQTIFINLADRDRSGTANASYFTSWDLGIGGGVAVGGYIIEKYGFSSLFSFCLITVTVGIIFFGIWAAPHFNIHKLR